MYRFGNSTEDICIQKIEAGIRGINGGTKTPQTADVAKYFTRLKPLNEGMHADLMKKYAEAVMKHKAKEN